MILFSCCSVSAQQPEITEEAIDSWHRQAVKLTKDRKFEEAEALFKKILAAKPNSQNVCFELGTLYLVEQRYDESLNCYEEALKLEANTEYLAKFYFNFAVCFAQKGNTQEAISYFNKCLEINPNYTGARELLEMQEQAYRTGAKVEVARIF